MILVVSKVRNQKKVRNIRKETFRIEIKVGSISTLKLWDLVNNLVLCLTSGSWGYQRGKFLRTISMEIFSDKMLKKKIFIVIQENYPNLKKSAFKLTPVSLFFFLDAKRWSNQCNVASI